MWGSVPFSFIKNVEGGRAWMPPRPSVPPTPRRDLPRTFCWGGMKIVLPLLLLFGAAAAAPAYAESARPAIEAGMTMAEILRLWGPPQERDEQESRRREIWRYSSGVELVFNEGVLMPGANGISRRGSDAEAATSPPDAVPSSEGQRSAPLAGATHLRSQDEASPPPPKDGNPSKSTAVPSKTPQTTREILSEIMRQYPDDGVVDVSKSTSPPSAPLHVAPPAMAPSGPPPPIPGSPREAEELLDEDEVLE